jgi:hypothetical protein
MRALAVGLFLAGLLLWILVMFFGVQRRIDDERVGHRRWPLAVAALLVIMGVLLYARPVVTPGWIAAVALLGVGTGVGAWWFVKRSAEIPSSDPEDDPRYRFQGHVARVTEAFEPRGNGPPSGRIAFSFDGRTIELRALWSPEGGTDRKTGGRIDDEVVIERVEGDLAYVEPWAVVEERL